MKMMFPTICRLIGEQRLIHNVSDLYMYLQRLYLYNREGLLKPAAGGFFEGIVGQFCKNVSPKRIILWCFSA